MERRIPGILWGKSWFFCESKNVGFGLISEDGPRYYRRHGNPQRLLHFLVAVKPEKFSGWFSNTRSNQGYVLGRHTFHHRLVLDGRNWKEAGMVRRSQQALSCVPVLNGKPVSEEKGLSIEPECVRLQGELELVGAKPNHSAAERLFREALSIAGGQGARSWELRAAMSLARLLQGRDQRKEALALLVPVLESFKEGLDTTDCVEAKALIASLD